MQSGSAQYGDFWAGSGSLYVTWVFIGSPISWQRLAESSLDCHSLAQNAAFAGARVSGLTTRSVPEPASSTGQGLALEQLIRRYASNVLWFRFARSTSLVVSSIQVSRHGASTFRPCLRSLQLLSRLL